MSTINAALLAPCDRGLLEPQEETSPPAPLERHGGPGSFGSSGKSAAARRAVGGVTLASGDPIGDPERRRGATKAWPQEAREHGWTPTVRGASEEGEAIYARHGLDASATGDEVIHRNPGNGLIGYTARQLTQPTGQLDGTGAVLRPTREPRHLPFRTTSAAPPTGIARHRAESLPTAPGLSAPPRRDHRTSTAGQR
ncbi:phosphatidylglycerol lysyltransferase domain-containing protein [Streptantibioticus rubrisoli]|uniref:Phosphatidylglycerol lysyltransferase domain-containing protein n=1 Tax=Streptantibioticus rubrisoli TaxID=1387313 RepID=A0ABT1PN52_9ACTN|nr:phosphatidylglycerol lysyltransferase domain-containing protein [Streptantibioticus rubrisoli]MCQ4046216.1 phosphatidylglycerol lysyltransferase domain-containing protein [Streptantibioticus rubrisoli]